MPRPNSPIQELVLPEQPFQSHPRGGILGGSQTLVHKMPVSRTRTFALFDASIFYMRLQKFSLAGSDR